MSDGAWLYRRSLVHHDRTGPAVDDHLGLGLSRTDIQALHFRHECHTLVGARGCPYLDGPAVQRGSRTLAESDIDGIHRPPGSGKIGRVKLEPNGIVLRECRGHGALNRRPAGNTPDAQMVNLHLAAAGGSPKSAHQQVTL